MQEVKLHFKDEIFYFTVSGGAQIVKNKIDYSNYDILFDIGKSLSLFGNIKSIDTFKNTLEKEKFEMQQALYEQRKAALQLADINGNLLK